MSKGIKIYCQTCRRQPKDCPLDLGDTIYPTPWVHPDCPLPDWPSVSVEQVRQLASNFVFKDSRLDTLENRTEFFINDLRSIGVEIKEEKYEQKKD